jgi:hypothetical protein
VAADGELDGPLVTGAFSLWGTDSGDGREGRASEREGDYRCCRNCKTVVHDQDRELTFKL